MSKQYKKCQKYFFYEGICIRPTTVNVWVNNNTINHMYINYTHDYLLLFILY